MREKFNPHQFPGGWEGVAHSKGEALGMHEGDSGDVTARTLYKIDRPTGGETHHQNALKTSKLPHFTPLHPTVKQLKTLGYGGFFFVVCLAEKLKSGHRKTDFDDRLYWLACENFRFAFAGKKHSQSPTKVTLLSSILGLQKLSDSPLSQMHVFE